MEITCGCWSWWGGKTNGMIISGDYVDAKMKSRKFQAWNEVWYIAAIIRDIICPLESFHAGVALKEKQLLKCYCCKSRCVTREKLKCHKREVHLASWHCESPQIGQGSDSGKIGRRFSKRWNQPLKWAEICKNWAGRGMRCDSWPRKCNISRSIRATWIGWQFIPAIKARMDATLRSKYF